MKKTITSKPRVKAPTKNHVYAIGHDLLGNTFVAIKCGRHVDYIYGMFKGRELLGGHLDRIESWHLEGEQVPFTGHPIKGDIVLELGKPTIDNVREITGEEAKAIIARMAESN